MPARSRRGYSSARDPASCSNRLAQEALVLPDDGQLDEPRSAVVVRRKADRKPADVVIADLLHRADEFLAREIVAGAAQALDEHLGRDEALEARERVVLLSSGGLQELLVLLHDPRGEIPGERHDLRDADAASCGTGFMRERLASYERDVQELRVAARRARFLDEGRAG